MTAIVGRRFGRLTVVCEAARMHRKRRWICVCSCGAQTTAYQWSLLAGRSRSCGCLKSEELRLKSAELNERRGNENHGMHGSAEYKCWLLMKNRCYNRTRKTTPTLAHGVCVSVKLGGPHFRAFTMTWARAPRALLAVHSRYGRIWAWKLSLGSQAARRAP